MIRLIPWSFSWEGGFIMLIHLFCFYYAKDIWHRCLQTVLSVDPNECVYNCTINKLSGHLNHHRLCFTWGHSPPDVARLIISFMVFFRESGSTRDTNTGCTARNSPLKQIKIHKQVFFILFLAKATEEISVGKS